MEAILIDDSDFTSGVQVTYENMLSWHEEVLTFLQTCGKKNSVYSINSGNGIVVGIKYKNSIRILECASGFKDFEYHLKK